MDEKKKKIIFLVGSIFVAVIFLTSYAAFSNNNTGTTSTTTVKSQNTVFASGSANATVSNYSDVAYVTLLNNSNQSRADLSNTILQLQSNGSVSDYIYTNQSFQVVLSTISSYQLQQILYNETASNSIAVASTTYITIPREVTLYYSKTPINIFPQSRNYSVYVQNLKPIGALINVSISALLTSNGSVYNNNIRVTSSN